MPLLQRLRCLTAGAALQFRASVLSPLAIVSTLLTPLTYGILVALSADQDPTDTFVGVALAGIWATLLTQSLFVILQERSWHTMEGLVAAPVPIVWPLLGRLLAVLAQGLLAVPMAWLCVWVGWSSFPFGAQILVAISTGALFFLGVGTVLLAVFARYRFAPGATNSLFGLVVLLSGLVGASPSLPGWLRVCGDLLGSTWSMHLVSGSGGSGPVQPLLMAVGLGTAWLLLGAVSLARVEQGMRRRSNAFSDG